MTQVFWLSQLFGGLALLFDIVKFTRTKRSALLLWGIPAGWSMVASQYFLGQSQGAVFQAMASLESILQTITGQDSRKHRYRRIAIAVVFGFTRRRSPGGLGFLWGLIFSPVWESCSIGLGSFE